MDCAFARGSGNSAYDMSFKIGSFFGGNPNAICHLGTSEGELVMQGSKKHINVLEKLHWGKQLGKRVIEPKRK